VADHAIQLTIGVSRRPGSRNGTFPLAAFRCRWSAAHRQLDAHL